MTNSNKLIILSVVLLFVTIECINCQNLQGSFETKFKRYQKNESFTGTPTQTWRAIAWKGERINKQIVLWNDELLENLEYNIESFKNDVDSTIEIDSKSITLRFPSYVKGDVEARSCTTVVEGEGFDSIRPFTEIADALIETPITKILPDDLLKLWLTINISQNQPAGNYMGSIVVLQNKRELKRFTVNIQVLDFQLPKPKDWKFHLDIWQWPLQALKHYNLTEEKKIQAWSKAHFKLLKPFYKILANMGQKVIFTQLNEKETPLVKWIRNSNGAWQFNFEAFDDYVLFMESLGITKQISCHSILGSKKNKLPYFDEEENSIKVLELKKWSQEYNQLWSQFLRVFKKHLIKKGWFYKTALYFDELRLNEMDEVVSFMNNLDSNWKLAMAYGHVQSESTMQVLEDASGILGVANNTGRKNKTNTFYTSCTEIIPNNYTTPVNNVAEMTWMPWHATREGFNGYLRWAFDYWIKEDPFDSRDGGFTSGDFSMVYRSNNGKGMKPVLGIRTEMLREGIQDFEKIGILKEFFLKKAEYQKVKQLDEMISKFSASSGVYAEDLVKEAQNVLVALATGNSIVETNKELSPINVQFNKDHKQIILNIQKEFLEVEILTYSGKRILLLEYNEPVKGSKIDVSNLSSDFYLIRIKSKEKTFVEVVFIPRK